MLNNPLISRYRLLPVCCLAVLLPALLLDSSAAELSTLFSTPQERQIINANRYKADEVKQPKANNDLDQKKVVPQEEVTKTLTINGITVSGEGPHSVWINNQMYLDGERIEGKSRVNVIVGNKLRVRIIAPDGKQYFATSGESVEVKYMEATGS